MSHRIKIRLVGVNEFVEVFPGASVNDAKAVAQTRYPQAKKITWMGAV